MASSDNQEVDINEKKTISSQICQTLNCGKQASLQCPTCIKLGIKEESHFCTQV